MTAMAFSLTRFIGAFLNAMAQRRLRGGAP